jgi:hypothetical protein
MILRNSLTIGATIAASLLLGPIGGLIVGSLACIAIALGDFFGGDWLFGKLFGNDLQSAHDDLERISVDKAYGLFDLTAQCTDAELKEAYRAAIRKYHPDKFR